MSGPDGAREGMFQDGVRRVLLLDAASELESLLGQALGATYRLRRVSSFAAALAALEPGDIDAVLLNCDPPASAARAYLQASTRQASPLPAIALGGDGDAETGARLCRLGAYDYFPQPLMVGALRFALERACRHTGLLRELAAARRLLGAAAAEELLGSSPALRLALDRIHNAAPSAAPVLILGEDGTGKRTAAQALHRLGPWSQGPFVTVDCSLPEAELRTELGAAQPAWAAAAGGTLFLTRAWALAPALRAQLPRLIQAWSAAPVVRLVFASSRAPRRLAAVRIEMPALRDRAGDIPVLAGYFLRAAAARHLKPVAGMTPGYLGALMRHRWPGNVRELRDAIERGVLAASGPQLEERDLPPEIKIDGAGLEESVRNFKRWAVEAALCRNGHNKQRTAHALGISRAHLHRLLHQMEIEPR